MDTQDRIQQLDADYEARTDGIDLRERSRGVPKEYNKHECWWPGCNGKARVLGLCVVHYRQHKQGSLVKTQWNAFPRHEYIQLYQDIVAYADDMEIDIKTAVSWLLAKGLDAYERDGE